LASDRITLVRHSGRTLLPLSERFFYLTELTFLQGTNFRSELVQRRPDQSQSSHIFRMTITLQRLCRDWSSFSTQLVTYILLNKRINVCISTNSTRNFPELNTISGKTKAFQIPFHLFMP